MNIEEQARLDEKARLNYYSNTYVFNIVNHTKDLTLINLYNNASEFNKRFIESYLKLLAESKDGSAPNVKFKNENESLVFNISLDISKNEILLTRGNK